MKAVGLSRTSCSRRRARVASADRRLSAERLEPRLCLSAVRVVSWNTANGPNGTAADADFRTVFQAIGNETVGGNTLAPSIVALQETDNLQLGGNSIARIEAILESLYPQTDYDRAVTTLDSGDDATGFVFDADIFDLISTSVVAATPGMTPFAHHILRGQFRPDGTTGQSDFYIYTTHLKAGSNGADAGRRTAEAAAIRADIDALGPGQDVLVVGDFNISGSNEGAYQNFLAAGNGRLIDPIDSPGQWKNNPAFVGIHTQNPAINGPGGMDDRFDFQLATAAVFDDQGLQYIEGSYRAFGNNGTHTFNSDITTGSGASPSVLSALAAASDHLPVVADYEIDVELSGVTISQTESSTVVSEAGASDSYSVVLNSLPTSNVVMTITTDGQTLVDGAVSKTIVFTPGNALVPRSFTITAVDDGDDEGTQISRVIHHTMSDDPKYNSLPDSVLEATVVDNDTPNVVISEIMYNPSSIEPDGEWVEIINLGPGTVDVSGWLLDDEDDSNWTPIPAAAPPLAAGDIMVIHNSQIPSSTFRSRWSVPAEAQVIGVTWGSLANGPSAGNEILELLDGERRRRDLVNYDDNGTTWPADNNGSSIYLPDPFSDNNVGGNWSISQSGIDQAVSPSGAPFSFSDVASPGIVAGVDFTPPQVAQWRYDESAVDDQQRSMLRSVTVVFDQVVSVQTDAFELTKRDVDAPADEVVQVTASLTEVAGRSEAKLTFAGMHVDATTGSLTDGNYTLKILGDRVSSQSGVSLGENVSIGDEEADAFFRLFGDADGDRDVDGQDYGRFGLTFLQTDAQHGFNFVFDGDGDGDVDGQDYGRFGQNFLGTLPF